MAIAATLALLDAEMQIRVGHQLVLTGQFNTNLDGSSQVWRIGLRKGIKSVGVTTASPLALVDADVMNLSLWSVERVLDEAELFSNQLVLAKWFRAVQTVMEAASDKPNVGGWLYEAKATIKSRVSELKLICEIPFEEPIGPVEVADSFAAFQPRFGWPFTGLGGCGYGFASMGGDAVFPVPQLQCPTLPGLPLYDAGFGGWDW